MRKTYVIALIIFSVAILFAGGCSDRGEKTPTASNNFSDWAGWTDADWAYRTSAASSAAPAQFLFQLRNPDALWVADIIVPKEAWPAPIGNGQRVPLLVLLAPENQGEYFFRDHGLYELSSQMVESGEIQPMIIVCMGNDPTFGGYFYGNSYAGGQYDAIIADTNSYPDSDFGNIARGLLSQIENVNNLGLLLQKSPDKRGIGGFGQGAYGAFRAILKHPGVYKSISVADGPLSFDHGLDDLIPQAIVEQQALWTAKGKLGSFDDMALFDTAATAPLSRMFVGGAISFSPNDTLIDYTLYPVARDGEPDTVVIDNRYQWTDSDNSDTSSTLVSNLIHQSLIRLLEMKNDLTAEDLPAQIGRGIYDQ